MSRDLAVRSGDRPGVVRTGLTLLVLVAVLVGSWALVIGAVWLVWRLLT